MAISAVSSVYYGNRYNSSFEGKNKKRDTQHSAHSSNPVSHKLAIPLAAVMLAMYPGESISAQDNYGTKQVTELYKKSENFEILHSRVLDTWAKLAPEEEPVPHLTVHFISDDGNQDNIEGIILQKSGSKYAPEYNLFLKAKQLRIVKDKANNTTRYIVVGDATVVNKSSVMRKTTNTRLEIKENMFKYLEQFVGGEVNNNAISRIIVVED